MSPADSAANAAVGVRQSRSSGPALEGEILRLRMENEIELERLREQNRRLRQLVDANCLGQVETASPSVTPRTHASQLPISPQHLMSALPHPSMRSQPDLQRSMYGAHREAVRALTPVGGSLKVPLSENPQRVGGSLRMPVSMAQGARLGVTVSATPSTAPLLAGASAAGIVGVLRHAGPGIPSQPVRYQAPAGVSGGIAFSQAHGGAVHSQRITPRPIQAY